jgi:hypothetical protein
VWSVFAAALAWFDGLVARLGRAIANGGRWLYRRLERLQAIPRALEAGRFRNLLFAGLTIAAALFLTVLMSLEAVLRDLHRLGGEVFGIGALTNGLVSFPNVDHYTSVLLTWKEMAEAANASSTTILTTYASEGGHLHPGGEAEEPHDHGLAVAFADPVVVVVPALVALLTLLVDRPLRRRHFWKSLVVARGGLLVVVLLFGGLFISDQSVDALRRRRDDAWDATFATILLAWTAVVVVGSVGAVLQLTAAATAP